MKVVTVRYNGGDFSIVVVKVIEGGDIVQYNGAEGGDSVQNSGSEGAEVGGGVGSLL